MAEDALHQSIVDQEHVKLLSLGFKVSAGMNAFFALFALLYVLMGVVMATALSNVPADASKFDQAFPSLVGWLFAGIGLTFFLVLITLAILKFRAATCLKRRTSRTFCLVMAAISCLEIPWGTVFGVLAFMVLERDSVVALFASKPGCTVPQ